MEHKKHKKELKAHYITTLVTNIIAKSNEKKMTGQTLICDGNTIGIKNVNWQILLEWDLFGIKLKGNHTLGRYCGSVNVIRSAWRAVIKYIYLIRRIVV